MPFAHTLSFEPAGELILWRVKESPLWFHDQLSISKRLKQEYHEIQAPNVRLQWLASRFALQQVAKSRDMDINKDVFGKPHLVNDNRYISISHCDGYAAAIAADAPVGVDVEIVSDRVQRIKSRFLSEDEIAVLGTTDADLMLAWSAKESIYKLHGEKSLVFKDQIIIKDRNRDESTLHIDLLRKGQRQQLLVRYQFLEHTVLSWVCLS